MTGFPQLTCVIVDDNELDLTRLAHYVDLTPTLCRLASFTSAPAALAFLQAHPEVDLLLLDIEMPEMPELTGPELLRQLPQPWPTTIITTAHCRFAVEAFSLHLADYLLKPVAYDRFCEAIDLVVERHHGAAGWRSAPALAPAGGVGPAGPLRELFVKVNNRLVRLNFDEVLYIEAMSTYSVFVTARCKHIVHLTLKNIAERLPFAHFRRVHRSYIVNTELIDSIEGGVLLLAGYEVPLAKSYQEELLQTLRSL